MSQEVSFEESFESLFRLPACHNRKVALYITNEVIIVNQKNAALQFSWQEALALHGMK